MSNDDEIIELVDILKQGKVGSGQTPKEKKAPVPRTASEKGMSFETPQEAPFLDFQFEDERGAPTVARDFTSEGPDEDLDNVLAGLKTQLEQEDSEFVSRGPEAYGLSEQKLEEMLTPLVTGTLERVVQKSISDVAESVIRKGLAEIAEKVIRETVAEAAERVIQKAIDSLQESLRAPSK